MPKPIRSLGFLVILALMAAAHGAAPPAGLDPEPFTAFPNVEVPMRVLDGVKGPNGEPVKRFDVEKLVERPMAIARRPVPADATPLRKVQIAQVYEGTLAFLGTLNRLLGLGCEPKDATAGMRLAEDVFRVAIELEDTPAGRVAIA